MEYRLEYILDNAVIMTTSCGKPIRVSRKLGEKFFAETLFAPDKPSKKQISYGVHTSYYFDPLVYDEHDVSATR